MVRSVEINDSQFNNLVLRSALPVLLEFASPECIICKTMSERIQEASKEYASKMVFLRMNINDNKKWKDFDVRVIPTLLYFKNGVLINRHDVFPEVEEIRNQIRSMVKRDAAGAGTYAEFKSAIDLEYIASRFYKHVTANVKNGQTREKFKMIIQESLMHKDFLQGRLQEITGETYEPSSSSRFEGVELKPSSFSLVGALKMALKIEEKLLFFYKKLEKDRLFKDHEPFKKLLKEEKGHFKAVQREMRFVQERDLFNPMDKPDYPSWLQKVFE